VLCVVGWIFFVLVARLPSVEEAALHRGVTSGIISDSEQLACQLASVAALAGKLGCRGESGQSEDIEVSPLQELIQMPGGVQPAQALGVRTLNICNALIFVGKASFSNFFYFQYRLETRLGADQLLSSGNREYNSPGLF
jgi:hypothetical protein